MLLRTLPEDAVTRRSVHGPRDPWGLPEQLLALVVDVLQVANWQRGGDKKAPRPKPIPRPGVGGGPRRTELSGHEIEARLRRLHRRDAERRTQEVRQRGR